MKATITDVPQPKPPRMVTLEMTEAQAEILGGIAATNQSVPEVVANYRLIPHEETAAVLRQIIDALKTAGVRRR